MATAKIKFVVRKVPQASDSGWGNSGPFVVYAASPRGAVQAVRNRYKPYVTGHIRQQTHVLEVVGHNYFNRAIGKTLA